MQAWRTAALAVVVLFVAGVPRVLGVSVGGSTLAACTGDDDCRSGETCAEVLDDNGDYKDACRAFTAKDNEACTPAIGCAGSKHLCIKGKCKDRSELRSSTTKKHRALPVGVFRSEGTLSTDEKDHFKDDGANDTVQCIGNSAVSPRLEVEDVYGQRITAEVACHPDLLQDRGLRVTYEHNRIGVQVSNNGTGFIVQTETPVSHMHINCLHGSKDVAERKHGTNDTAWFFYGPLVYPTSDTMHHCELFYEAPGETDDDAFDPAIPTTIRGPCTTTRRSMRSSLDDAGDDQYAASLPTRKISHEFI